MGNRKKIKKMRILAIETSCDETAIALVEFEKNGTPVRVLKNLISSQIPIHQKYGGVVPEVAARTHVMEIVTLLDEAFGSKLKAQGSKLPFDAIAVTRGPGLATALRVGLETGRTLAYALNKPIVGINHLEGHIASAWLNTENRRAWQFPLLALIVSGGHTELVLMKDFCQYKIVGQTRDDAAGEAFDKSAKLMGLPYPGGPQIAKLADGGDAKVFELPRPMMKHDSFDFSFSGLKTAVRQTLERHQNISKKQKQDFTASLQQAIVDVLIEKTLRAAKRFKVKGVLVVGGVSANRELRRQLGERIVRELKDVAFLPSDLAYITDNAAMIATAGFWRLQKGEKHDWKKMDVDPEWNLE